MGSLGRLPWLCAVAGALGAGSLLSGCALVGVTPRMDLVGGLHGSYQVLADDGTGPSPSGTPPGPTIPAGGWAASPTVPDVSFLDAAMRLCPGLAGRTLTLLIQDQRGPVGAAFVWTDGDTEFECFVGRADGRDHVQAISAGSAWPAGSPLQLTGIDCGPPTVVTGNSGSGTPGVTIATASGRTVTASVAGGHFVAWWPGEDDPVSVTGTIGEDTAVILLEADRTCAGDPTKPSISPAP